MHQTKPEQTQTNRIMSFLVNLCCRLFSCSADTDLFPNFSRFKRGTLMSEFGAFRSTSMDSGAVEMNFTCVLQVCQDDCEEVSMFFNVVVVVVVIVVSTS